MNLTILKTFATVVEAEAAKNLLEAHGVKAIFQTTKPGSSGYLGNATGGELYVREEDVEKAKELVEKMKR